MTNLRELEKRLEEATGPDRELDLEIAKKLFGFSLWKSKHGYWNITWPDSWPYRDAHASITVSGRDPSLVYDPTTGEKLPPEKEPTDWADMIDCPHYTASLDAAVALVERCLPDAFPTIDRYSISDEPTTAQYNWRVWIKWVDGDDIIREAFSGTKSSPALALCLALIRTLIAKGDRHD